MIFTGLVCVWIVVAFVAGFTICAGIRMADEAMETAELLNDTEPDDDWLADQPVDVLSQAEIDRRIGEMARLYRHDRQWSAWGWTA